jgi:hypothetical protein
VSIFPAIRRLAGGSLLVQGQPAPHSETASKPFLKNGIKYLT